MNGSFIQKLTINVSSVIGKNPKLVGPYDVLPGVTLPKWPCLIRFWSALIRCEWIDAGNGVTQADDLIFIRNKESLVSLVHCICKD